MATAKKLPSGTWAVRVYVGRSAGKDKYKMFTAPTKREAERKASNYLIINNHTELTFADASIRYIEAKKNVLSPNTIRTYRQRRQKLEALFSVRMTSLSSERVQRIVDRLSAELSPKTVRAVYGFLTAVVKMFEPSLVLSVTMPEPEHKEALIPTEEDVRRMIDAAPSEDLKLAIQMAAFGSLRSGECCALAPDMVFLDRIRVSRTFVLDDEKGWIIKNSPKTSAGFRDVPLPAPILEPLRVLAANSDNIIKYNPGSLHDAFRRLTRRLDMPPYRFHSLRHFFASQLHASGVPDKVIAKIGGWEDVGTLQRIYQHATADKIKEAGDILADLFRKTM